MKKARCYLFVFCLCVNSLMAQSGLSNPACNNFDFGSGTFTGWTGAVGYNLSSDSSLKISAAGISTLGANASEKTCAFHTLVNTGTDPYSGLPMVDPGGGSWALRLGGEHINVNVAPGTHCQINEPPALGYGSNGEIIENTFAVVASNALFRYSYSIVMDGSVHPVGQEPYFRAEALDVNGHLIPSTLNFIQATGVAPLPGFFASALIDTAGNNVNYCPWTQSIMDLRPYIGQNVTLRFTAAGCIAGGHFAYAYIDGDCSPARISATPQVCLGGTQTLTGPAAGIGGTYVWNTLPSGTAGIVGSNANQSVTVNANGTYQVTVTPSSGIPLIMDTTIAFYPNPTVTAVAMNTSCAPGNDGQITATATAGSTPYTYSWSPAPGAGQGTATVTALGAGTYTVVVTTTDGCTVATSATVASPGALLSMNSTPVTCNGANDGTALVTATGGTSPYTYSWNTTPVVAGANASMLAPGTYTVQVTDHGGCISYATVSIAQPSVLNVTLAGVNPSCSGCADGSATATVSGGTTAYTYSWSPAPGGGQGTANATGLGTGTYTCVITDNNHCTGNASTTLTFITGIDNKTESEVFTVYPNPANNTVRIRIGTVEPYSYSITLSNVLGQQVLGSQIAVTRSCEMNLDVSVLPEGIYFITLNNGNSKRVCSLVITR